MKLKAIQLRKGNIIKIDNELLIITDFVPVFLF